MFNSFYLKDISGFEVSKANLSWHEAKQVFKFQIKSLNKIVRRLFYENKISKKKHPK